jgi:sugar phosphate isomerase/epimerase
MRRIGFSTGAIAKADFRAAIECLHNFPIDVVEISALRLAELQPLIQAFDSLNLRQFSFVSIHAPSAFAASDEHKVISLLGAFKTRHVVVHPDAVHDIDSWADVPFTVVLENMDLRKHNARSADELEFFFDKLPKAKLCFDIGHAKSVDPTMYEAERILRKYSDRLAQVHISEVTSRGSHEPVSFTAIQSFSQIARRIPSEIPIIIESPVRPQSFRDEIEKVSRALPESGVGSASVAAA